MSLEVVGKGTEQQPFILSEESGFWESILLANLIDQARDGDIDPVVWLQMMGTDGRDVVAKADLEELTVLLAKDIETGKESPDAVEEFETLFSNVAAEDDTLAATSFVMPPITS